MAFTPEEDGGTDSSRPALAASWARQRWLDLDRGWQATVLGVLVVLFVSAV